MMNVQKPHYLLALTPGSAANGHGLELRAAHQPLSFTQLSAEGCGQTEGGATPGGHTFTT